MKTSILNRTALLAFLWIPVSLAGAQSIPAAPSGPSTAADALLQGFQNPPQAARPRVWWHWMNGNITEEGIRLDLEWMHRVGIGGVTIFQGQLNTPQVVPQPLGYMTPQWKKAFEYAVTTARNLGMDVTIASSPGWSETGGPWVPAREGMKKMVWSATRIAGGQPFTGVLPQPPQVSGPFQNDAVKPRRMPDCTVVAPPQFYEDAAVIAYRISSDDKTQAELNPAITASGGVVNAAALSDGDVSTVALALPAAAPGNSSWVQFDYGHPQTIQALTLACTNDLLSKFLHPIPAAPPRLEASEDGQHFREVAVIPFTTIVQRTVSFDPVTARYFRVVFPTAPNTKPENSYSITELVLHSGARVNEFEKRAGFSAALDYDAIQDPTVAPQSMVPSADVIDLTGKMKANGSLDWTPPAGNWMVLRIGASLTGHENGPAPADATGLEVDKLNRADVKSYIDGYLETYAQTVGAQKMGKNGISALLTDSIETGPQNWTDNMLEEFQQRRGYDPRPWLPALTGIVIDSTQATDKFLWDFRRTIIELLSENHYGTIADELHAHGLRYKSEALEYHTPMLGDDMAMRSHADIPMGAMWTWAGAPGPDPDYIADARGAASVAHVYGQNIAGAESMTSRGPAWSFAPNTLKKVADLEFALGINHFEIHESTHQPVRDMEPGLTLGRFGLWFNRNQTWADDAGPWIDYLARCSYLLQQGRFAADVAYFYGQDAPLTALYANGEPQDAPQDYGFDFINADAILHHLSVSDGRWVTSGGASYRILYLGGTSRRITVPVLRKLRDLVAEGGVLVGERPEESPSLADDHTEFHDLTNELWGKKPAKPGKPHRYRKGHVYAGMTPAQALAALDVTRDFSYSGAGDAQVLFVHRLLTGGDIYFVDNRADHPIDITATFRVTGKAPELWDAATGQAQPVSYRIDEATTNVPLHLEAYGTVFVVFRKPAAAPALQIPEQRETPVASLDQALNADWDVSFEPGLGAPESARFDHLLSWSDSPRYGIKYFSGTATYVKSIEIPASLLTRGTHLWLDLGSVYDLAKVAVNGQYLGVLWKSPYKMEITRALHAGSNQIVVQVTNLWVNRLIGDQQPWALRKYTFTDFDPYRADSPLLPSGLLGPVQIETSGTARAAAPVAEKQSEK